MTTLTRPAPHATATRQLAEDLGLVLDALLERTAQRFVERIQAHDLSLAHARVLRSLDRSLNAVLLDDVAPRAGLEPRSAARAVAQLRERDLDHTRRTDLQSFIEGLDPTERRRVEAAVSLLNGEL
jgi:hypothetical protein